MRCFYYTGPGDRTVQNQDALALPWKVVAAGNMEAPAEFAPFAKLHGWMRPLLCAVIDGMGGYKGGEVAAKLTAEAFSSVTYPDLVTEGFLERLLSTAATRLAVEALVSPELRRMGAVTAGVIVKNDRAVAFNCGDCRVYHWHDGSLLKVSYDHSIVQGLFDEGTITEDEQLPSIRQLSRDLKISVITITRAYTDLADQGFIISVAGKGYFVAPRDNELLRERMLFAMEENLQKAVENGRDAGLTDEEIIAALRQFMEG